MFFQELYEAIFSKFGSFESSENFILLQSLIPPHSIIKTKNRNTPDYNTENWVSNYTAFVVESSDIILSLL